MNSANESVVSESTSDRVVFSGVCVVLVLFSFGASWVASVVLRDWSAGVLVFFVTAFVFVPALKQLRGFLLGRGA